jgi:hypothetical protein
MLTDRRALATTWQDGTGHVRQQAGTISYHNSPSPMYWGDAPLSVPPTSLALPPLPGAAVGAFPAVFGPRPDPLAIDATSAGPSFVAPWSSPLAPCPGAAVGVPPAAGDPRPDPVAVNATSAGPSFVAPWSSPLAPCPGAAVGVPPAAADPRPDPLAVNAISSADRINFLLRQAGLSLEQLDARIAVAREPPPPQPEMEKTHGVLRAIAILTKAPSQGSGTAPTAAGRKGESRPFASLLSLRGRACR